MFLQLRYPLRPSSAQHARLAAILRLQRNLYNAALERRRAALDAGRHLALRDDQAVLAAYRAQYAEHAALPWGVNDWTLRRLDTAMRMYRDRLAGGEEPGLPRFRSGMRWRSFGSYGLKGWSLDGGRITLEGL